METGKNEKTRMKQKRTKLTTEIE